MCPRVPDKWQDQDGMQNTLRDKTRKQYGIDQAKRPDKTIIAEGHYEGDRVQIDHIKIVEPRRRRIVITQDMMVNIMIAVLLALLAGLVFFGRWP